MELQSKLWMRAILAMAICCLSYAAFRMVMRSHHFSEIELEVSQGYATDRWGYGPPETYDDGEVWGRQQKNAYDDRTCFWQIASIIAVVVAAGVYFPQYRTDTTTTDGLE